MVDIPQLRPASSCARRDAIGTFERFSDRARRVLVLAREEARLLDHGFIGTEHVLLGLLHEGDGIAAKALEQLGVTLEGARQRVTELIGTGGGSTDSPPFTPRAKKTMELALREALQLDHNYIGTEHLLLGLVREGEGVAAQVLVGYADMVEVRKKVLTLLRLQGDEEAQTATAPEAVVVTGPHTRLAARCSFCGRRTPETGRLVSSGRATICEHCIREWSQRLEDPDEAGAPAPDADPPES